jgi:2-methylcitrate dehydratase PrpD
MYDDPQQEMEARFSMSYCIAVAMLNGRVSLSDFTPDAVHREEVRAFMPRVSMEAYPQDAEGPDPTARLPHKVTITLKGGRKVTAQSIWARGTIHNPFDESDMEAKFRDCCEGFLAPDDYDAVLAMLSDFAGLKSIRSLTRRLAFEAGSDHGERFAGRQTLAAE